MSYEGPRELIEEARANGKWLHCAYQDLWFSPDELDAANRNGKFRWGPANWSLRDPQEMVAAADRRATNAKEEAGRLRARLGV